MKKILIVDADLAQRLALQDIAAERRDWRVIKAASAQEALTRLRSLELPDLCIFGASVGETSGADLLRQLRAEPQAPLRVLPVLLSVPESEREKVSTSLGLDPAYILSQPLIPARVLAAIGRLIS